MTRNDRVRDGDDRTEPKFYLPAASARPAALDWFDRVRATLFKPPR
ncbi:hypothetical protein [Halorubrum sp. Ea8]|nr:hypothetical protein [Halorubrum sp. Ea8]